MALTDNVRLLGIYADANDWTLVAGNDLTFVAGANLTARSAALRAEGGNVSSGTATIDIATTAGVSVWAQRIGTSTQRLVIDPGSAEGAVALRADDTVGMFVDIDIDTGSGSDVFATRRLTLEAPSLVGGTVVDLRILGGALNIDNTDGFFVGDDFVTLTTVGTLKDIAFSGSTTTLTAGKVTLTASGKILSGTAASDVISAGNIDLSATSIGAGPIDPDPANPLAIQFGGELRAAATAGDIWLLARLLPGQTSLDTTQITSLTTPLPAATVSLEVAGDITVAGTGGFSTLADDHLRLVSQSGAVNFTNSSPLSAGSVEIRAATDISSSSDGHAIATTSTGNINLFAGSGVGTGNIGSDGAALAVRTGGLVSLDNRAGDGNAYLSSDQALRLGTVLAGGSVAISAGGAITGTPTSIIDTSLAGGAIDLEADGGSIGDAATPLFISAGTGAVTPPRTAMSTSAPTGGLQLGAIVSTAGVKLRATGPIQSGSAPVDIETIGAIDLAAAGLCAQDNPLLLVNSGGNLLLASTTDVWIAFPEGELSTFQIKSLTPAPARRYRWKPPAARSPSIIWRAWPVWRTQRMSR